LSFGQRGADPRAFAVVPGSLGQQPACVPGAGLGDRTQPALLAAAGLGGEPPPRGPAGGPDATCRRAATARAAPRPDDRSRPLPGPAWNLRRRRHHALDPPAGELPRQPVPVGPPSYATRTGPGKPPQNPATRAMSAVIEKRTPARPSPSTSNTAATTFVAGAFGQRSGRTGPDSSGPPTALVGFQQRTAAVARVSASVPHGEPLSMNRLAWSKCRGLPIKGGLM
jgi:hypothetical protein